MNSQDLLLLLSKIAPLFIYPLGFTLLLIAVATTALWRRSLSLGRFALSLAFGLLWIASAPVTADALLGALERQYPPLLVEETPSADWAIVLGGAISAAAPPRKTIDLGEAADRVLLAARLFRAQKVERILVSGGAVPWGPQAGPEAEAIKSLLIEWGVPANRIEVETRSRNTFENARFSRDIIPLMKPALLITSAFHMPRAIAVFRKAGFDVLAAPTDIQVVHKPRLEILDLLPDASALHRTTLAIKELIGFYAYRWRGYI